MKQLSKSLLAKIDKAIRFEKTFGTVPSTIYIHRNGTMYIYNLSKYTVLANILKNGKMCDLSKVLDGITFNSITIKGNRARINECITEAVRMAL